jgi:hypothetical protein
MIKPKELDILYYTGILTQQTPENWVTISTCCIIKPVLSPGGAVLDLAGTSVEFDYQRPAECGPRYNDKQASNLTLYAAHVDRIELVTI